MSNMYQLRLISFDKIPPLSIVRFPTFLYLHSRVGILPHFRALSRPLRFTFCLQKIFLAALHLSIFTNYTNEISEISEICGKIYVKKKQINKLTNKH